MSAYYIRSRGRVTGPFALDALKQMARRGRLGRSDHVSLDRTSWEGAESLGLFASAATVEQAQVARDEEAFVLEPRNASSATPTELGTGWLYAQNGTAVGPLPANVLTALAQNGTLQSDDPVWQVGAEVAAPARQTPFLAPFFTSPSNKATSNGQRLVSNAYLRSIDRGQSIALIVRGVAMTLFVMLPFSVFKAGDQLEIVWWWDLFRSGLNVGIGVVHLIALLAGIAVVVLAATLTKIPRAASLMAVSGVVMMVWMVLWGAIAMDSPEPLNLLVFLGVVPALYLVSSINLFRLNSGAGATDAGKLTQGLCAGLLLLICMLWIITNVLALTSLPADVPGWAIAALIMSLAAAGSAVTAGVLSLVDLKPRYSRGILVGSVVCCWAAAATLATALFVLMAGMDHELAQSPFPFAGIGASLIWLLLRLFILYLLPVSVFASALVALLAHRSAPRA